MAVDISTFSARTSPAVRQPVFRRVNNLEAEAESAARELFAKAGLNALEIISSEAAMSARQKVKEGTDVYLRDLEEKLAANPANSEQIMQEALTGFEAHKAGLVREAKGGLLNRSLLLFSRGIEKSTQGENARVAKSILNTGAKAVKQNAVNEVVIGMSKIQTAAGMADFIGKIESRQGALEEKFPVLHSSAVARMKELDLQERSTAFENTLEQTVLGFMAEGAPDDVALSAAVDKMSVVGAENAFGLTRKEADAITSNFKAKVTTEKSRAKETIGILQQSNANNLTVQMTDFDPTKRPDIDDLNKSLIDKDISKSQYDSLVRLSKEKSDLDHTDNEVFKSFHSKLTKDPTSVSYDQLLAKLGNGLSEPDWSKLDKLRVDGLKSPLANRVIVEGHKSIDRIADARISNIDKSIEGQEKVDLIREVDIERRNDKTELDRWVESNPNATDAQQNDKITELNAPKVQEQALNWFQNLFGFQQGQFATIVGATPGSGVAVDTIEGFSGLIEPIDFDKIIPNTNAQFEAALRELNKRDPSKVQAFYDKWKGSF